MNKSFGTIPRMIRMAEPPIFEPDMVENEIELIKRKSSTKTWLSPTGEIFHISVPPTVYPPREDTDLLAKSILRLGPGKNRKCLEIGCGSGVLSALSSRQGWDVTACDINPFAVACTRGLAEENKIKMKVFEGGPSPMVDGGISQWAGEKKYDLVFWNLPYLRMDNQEDVQTLGPLEEAGLIDTDKNGLLNRTLKLISNGLLSDDGIALFVVSSQNEFSKYKFQCYSNGLATREISNLKFDDGEEIRVIAVWKPYSLAKRIVLQSVDSTNTFLLNSEMGEGSSVSSPNQISGHGRRNRQWIDYDESFAGSWILFDSIPKLSPGIIQILVGLSVVDALNCLSKDKTEILLKWPNDVLVLQEDEWRKVCGILIESKSSGDDNIIVAGIGINISGNYKGNFNFPVGFTKDFSDSITFDKINDILNTIMASNFERIEALPELTFSKLEKQINAHIKKAFSVFNKSFYRNSIIQFSRILEDGSIEIINQNQEQLIIDDFETISWIN